MMNHTAPSISWPPEYKIKKHRLARSVKLRASKLHGLEITVPVRYNLKNIPIVLEENKLWITKHLLHLLTHHAAELPDKIIAHSIPHQWSIEYVECVSKLELIQRSTTEIVLVGKVQNKEACKEKLIKWVKNQADVYLTNELTRLSQLMLLPYHGLTIRDQQTVWGSCTARKSINLNYKLLFLPKHLVEYVIIHELCHTKHMNHSIRFWDLVGQWNPDWRANRRELRQANQFMPSWI